MVINVDEIKELLNSDITSYAISKQTKLAPHNIEKYRKGESKLDLMTIGVAKKLMKYINENK